MGIVDYLSRDPIGEPWPESELDKKFVVASIDQFHEALDCLNSRLVDTNTFINDENILEHSQERSAMDEILNTSSHGCYSNRPVQKRTKLEWNENSQRLRLSNCDQNTLSKISSCIQSVYIKSNENKRNIDVTLEKKFAK